jgi:hypothetical protein
MYANISMLLFIKNIYIYIIICIHTHIFVYIYVLTLNNIYQFSLDGLIGLNGMSRPPLKIFICIIICFHIQIYLYIYIIIPLIIFGYQ